MFPPWYSVGNLDGIGTPRSKDSAALLDGDYFFPRKASVPSIPFVHCSKPHRHQCLLVRTESNKRKKVLVMDQSQPIDSVNPVQVSTIARGSGCQDPLLGNFLLG